MRRFNKIMSFTPHSASSLAHRKFMLNAARSAVKGARTKQYVVLEDPLKAEREAEKVIQTTWPSKKNLTLG